MPHLVVDAMNVIGSRPDGWWRDRAGAAERLLEALARLSAEEPDGVTVVLDGRPLEAYPEGRYGAVEVHYARRRGRDAADDRIAEIVAAHPAPDTLTVVTSDRGLRERVMALGAAVAGPRWLLERLDRLDSR